MHDGDPDEDGDEDGRAAGEVPRTDEASGAGGPGPTVGDASRVDWREWGPEPFEAAREAGKPLLLSLVATWCGDCHRMDAETYGEPRIAAHVEDGFVPVRVDVDRRPRVRERYNVGGFPSNVFCTPSGAVLTGATYLGPDGFRQVLDRVRETYDAKGESAGRIPRAVAAGPPPAGPLPSSVESGMTAALTAAFDDAYGGWRTGGGGGPGSGPGSGSGTEVKFPLPCTVEFALKRESDQAVRTLDAVREHLLDDVDGGFFRYARARNWSDPAREKTLVDNAALVRAFANGYLHTGADRFRRAADATVGFLTDDLWTGAAVGGSRGPAAGRDYYRLPADERADEPTPRTDLTAFAGGNALAVDALLTYHAYTDDGRAGEYADRIRSYLASRLVDGDGRVSHYRGADAPAGLLADQARVSAAFVRASQVRGEGLEVARAAADWALDALRLGSEGSAGESEGGSDEGGPAGDDGEFDAGVGTDPDPDHDDDTWTAGALCDGPVGGPGLLDRPLYPLDDAVAFADACVDLWALTDESRYRTAARETLEAFGGATDRIGVRVAGFAGVAARLRTGPLVIDVATDPGSDLHRAALRVADHEKVVVPDATDRTPPGTASVRGFEAAPAETPDALMGQVAAATDR
jgi:hypothetical protein